MALTIEFFLARIQKSDDPDGCWIWTGQKDPKGYGMMLIKGDRKYRATRFSYENFVAPVPDWSNLQCCHHCDNPSCVNPKHLFVGTRRDNMQDCVRKGRHWAQNPANHARCRESLKKATAAWVAMASGSLNPGAKLDIAKLQAIFDMRKSGVTLREISARVGVSQKAVGNVLRGRSYKQEIRALKSTGRGE